MNIHINIKSDTHMMRITDELIIKIGEYSSNIVHINIHECVVKHPTM